jgi:uncharacterized membrane protein YdjX (TVP38/TMEM64 family)
MQWMEWLVLRLDDLGPWAPIFLIVAYIGASIALAPAFLLTVAAGAVFGIWRGSVLVFVGAVLGSSAVYGLASPLARSRFMKWIARDPRIAAVRDSVVDDGVWIMFLLRLSPVVPFTLLNYALALSGVSFRNYLIALVGMVPAIIMYTYYGKVVGDVALLAAGAPPRGRAYYVLLVVGLIATFMATTLIARAARTRYEEGKRLKS